MQALPLIRARYLKVAVPSPLRSTFDYLLADELAGQARPGQRVRVPFGSREVVGLVLGGCDESELPPEKIKPVLALLDEEPALDEATLNLYLWASAYYQFPVGMALQTSLPKQVRAGKPLLLKAAAGTEETTAPEPALALNPAQNEVLEAVCGAGEGFACHLLEGVTGSGKTEVYLQLIARVLASGRQVLVLVPEISLTPQTLARFRRRFGGGIVSLHSGLGDRERFEAWLRARSGEAGIVIGTRSAVFIPLARPGLIVVDEEHDPSYKQQEGFRYSGRDLAVYRARLHGIPVLLGSATPSLESLHNALSGRYRLHRLEARAGAARPPTFRFIDLRGEALDEGFSRSLLDEMAHHLGAGQQVLVFLNRRGYAPLLQCHDCGWVASCPRCDTAYTLHSLPPSLRCHHCDAQKPLPAHCPDCASADLQPVGQGTERSEAALQRLFPDVEVLRMDRDSTRPKDALDRLLERVRSGEPCILVGTQMLAKGHHFPAVTLVAVLDADGGLFSPDFRGQEHMGQLLIQVAGRAGRGDAPGQVLIQTHHVTHPSLNLLVSAGYGSFARRLLDERRAAGLPPFGSLALLRAEAVQRSLPERFLAHAAALSRHLAPTGGGCQVIGPLPAPMEKRAGRFRYQLWLQAPRRAPLHALAGGLLAELEAHPLARRLRWSLDIDPLDFS